MQNFSELAKQGKKIGEHDSGWIYEYDEEAYLTTGAFTMKSDKDGRFFIQARNPYDALGTTEIDIADVKPVLDFIQKYRHGYKPE